MNKQKNRAKPVVLVSLTSAIILIFFHFSQTAGGHKNKVIYQTLHY